MCSVIEHTIIYIDVANLKQDHSLSKWLRKHVLCLSSTYDNLTCNTNTCALCNYIVYFR